MPPKKHTHNKGRERGYLTLGCFDNRASKAEKMKHEKISSMNINSFFKI
jgi:hypothetical protein